MKETLRKIADCIIGIPFDDLTTSEHNIYSILVSKEIVTLDGENDVIRGRKY